MLALHPRRSWSQILLKHTLLIIIAAGIILSLLFSLLFIFKPSTLGSSVQFVVDATTPRAPEKVKPEVPVRLKIPKINVNAAIQPVGLTSQGDMDAPKNPDSTGWFSPGPRPGEIGSAVIDGHFGWENNTPAVFDDLHTLRAGDELYVEDKQGQSIVFVVRESRTYKPNENAPAVFISNDSKAHLNLITCGGAWDAGQRSYSSRLVVFADKKPE